VVKGDEAVQKKSALVSSSGRDSQLTEAAKKIQHNSLQEIRIRTLYTGESGWRGIADPG
jgi:hypothetical protein